MSTQLVNRRENGYELAQYNGGEAKGLCVQISGDNGYIQLSRTGAQTLIHDLIHLYLRNLPTSSDTAAVLGDEFGTEGLMSDIRAKLSKKRNEGHDGWYHHEKCPAERLALSLFEYVRRGDPVDIATIAMFLHARPDTKGVVAELFPVWLAQQFPEAVVEESAGLSRSERNLSRALGYIDRILQGEQPTGPQLEEGG